MIQLSFVRGSALRKVYIDGKKISLMAGEIGFVPIVIELDKLSSKEYINKIKKSNLKDGDLELLKELAKLNSEEDIIKDITKDFQETGWRRIK